jgi:hypothetical protein
MKASARNERKRAAPLGFLTRGPFSATFRNSRLRLCQERLIERAKVQSVHDCDAAPGAAAGTTTAVAAVAVAAPVAQAAPVAEAARVAEAAPVAEAALVAEAAEVEEAVVEVPEAARVAEAAVEVAEAAEVTPALTPPV